MAKDPQISPIADTLLAAEEPATAPSARAIAELPRGTSVGRYLILEKIGAGGMGIVYAAYDPKLDRRIALKALYAAGDPKRDTAGQTRLVREAKAMARLSHPNVVAVYDVVAEQDQALVAMELVEGMSLRAWLHEKRRDWRVVLDAFLQAGRGLASAHEAGLVHRDFKLDNVFMGNDGRVKVGDFGLARAAPGARQEPATMSEDGTLQLSGDGALVGTPVYMAPDQLRGSPADERSDQFSFCAALYEGFYGATPFEGTTLLSLMQSMDSERLRAVPPSARVPRRLRAILARGLRKRPEERFPNMRALLSVLEVDPRKGRRWGILAVAGLGGAGLLVGGVVRERRAHELECRAIGQRAAGAWDDAQHGAVRNAFVATGRPYAEDTFKRTASVLDAYTGQWAAQSTAACEEGREARTRELAVKRAACLDARLGELSAFVGVLGRAEGETVDRAVRAARALPSLETCSGRDPLEGEATPSDPTVRDEARALQQSLSLGAALRAAGKVDEELAAAPKNLAEAERLAFPPLKARALLMLGWAQEDAGDLATSEATYHRASLAAEEAGTWAIAARAFIGEATRAYVRGDFARADERFDHATVWVDRAGDDETLRGSMLLARSREREEQGDYDASRVFAAKALALLEQAKSDDATEAINQLGIADDMQGHYEGARAYYQRALDRYTELLGPDNPKVSNELNNLAEMEADQGNFDLGIRYLTRALEIQEKARGPNHPGTLESLSNLVGMLCGAKRYAEALPLALRAVPAAEKTFGPDTPDVAFALGPLAITYMGLHRSAEAIEPAEHELAIRLKTGAAPINVADAQCDLGSALVESGRDMVRGRALLKEAVKGFNAVGKTSRVPGIEELLTWPVK